MKVKLVILFLFILSISGVKSQVLRNDGEVNVSAGYLVISGDYRNESAAELTIDGIVSLTGDWTNNSSTTVITGVGTDGEVIFDGTTTQTIGGSASQSNFEKLTINVAAIVDLTAGKYISAQGATDISGTFTLKSAAGGTASYIAVGSVTGDFSSERYMTGSRWHILSSPVSTQAINTFITANTIDESPNAAPLYYAMTHYVESSNSWSLPTYTIASPPTSNMTVGQAYLTGIVGDRAITFTGAPNTGNKSISITNSGQGWNGVGNPYTSSLDVASLISTNASLLDDSYESLYLFNGTGYTLATTGYVQPGQGFLVKATGAGGSFSFTTAMQSHQNPTFYKKSLEIEEYAEIKLITSSEDMRDETYIRLYPDHTFGLDPGKDLGKYMGNLDFLLYSQLMEDNGVNFAIQALPVDSIEKISVPIGFNFDDGGSITFSTEIVNLPAGARVILEDRLLEKYTDLEGSSASYTVDLPAQTSGYGRFYFHTYDPMAVGSRLDDLKNFNIFAKNKTVYIRGDIDEISSVSVYDMMGKELKIAQLVPGNINTISLAELNDGLYIIRLTNSNVIHSEQVFLK